MSTRRRALFLSPEPPYPVIGGGPLRSASLLHFLSARFDTDLFTCREQGAPDPLLSLPPQLVQRAFACTLPLHARHTLARLWRNADRLRRGTPPLLDRFQAIGPDLAAFVAGQQYDVALIEHFWCAPHASILRPHTRRLVLDLHNLESEWHTRCGAASRGPERWAHARFAAGYRALERRWLPAFDDILVTSSAAAENLPAAAHVYPNALPWHAQPTGPRAPVIAFSGNFEYLPNLQGVRYFREQIWPLVRSAHPAAVWRLVGRNPNAVAAFTSGDSRIETTGPVPDAIEELGQTQVAVVPLLSGSGTRLKILEAWAAGTPVVSTALGAEGLNGEHETHWLRADSPLEFASSIVKILQDSDRAARIGAAGRQRYEESYTWEAAWQTLKWLEDNN